MSTIIDGTTGVTVPGTGSVVIAGSSSGTATIVAPAAAGTPTLTLPTATGTLISTADAATQANQETATSTTTFVSPGRQQYHPSAAKVWIQCNQNGAIAGSYNVASIADTGTGIVTITLTTAFSSTNYSAIGSNDCGGGGLFAGASITSASVYRLLSMNTVTQTAQDSNIYFSVAFGDQ